MSALPGSPGPKRKDLTGHGNSGALSDSGVPTAAFERPISNQSTSAGADPALCGV